MTVGRLHKALTKLIDEGHARKPVTINKNTFTHPLEGDGCVILPVDGCSIEWVEKAHPDGGLQENVDGSIAGSFNVVLSGES